MRRLDATHAWMALACQAIVLCMLLYVYRHEIRRAAKWTWSSLDVVVVRVEPKREITATLRGDVEEAMGSALD